MMYFSKICGKDRNKVGLLLSLQRNFIKIKKNSLKLKTKNLMKMASVLAWGAVMPAQMNAQESDGNWSLNAGLDAVSGYWWRGLHSADLSVQPTVSFDYEKEDWALSLGLWGTKSLSGDRYDEIDLFAEASWRNFTLSLTDYYDCSDLFPYNLGHSLDVGLSYTVSEKFPLTLSWYSIVLGTTYEDVTDVPSYLELSYPFSISVVDFNATVGFVPMESYYYCTEKAEFNQLGLSAGHEFELGSFTLPVSVQYNYNPALDDHFCGVSVGCYFSTGL